MQTEAATASPVPMFKFNPEVPKDDTIRHVSCLPATVRGRMLEVDTLRDDEIAATDVRLKAWAAFYLPEMADTITDTLAI